MLINQSFLKSVITLISSHSEQTLLSMQTDHAVSESHSDRLSLWY